MQEKRNRETAGDFWVPGTPSEIAWAAGLFEGEGTISSKPQGTRGSGAQLRLGMNDKDVVERFRKIVGCGGLYAHKPGTGSTKPNWTWYVYDADKVTAILSAFLPFLGARRSAKAMEALEVTADIVAYAKRTHCPNGHAYEGENLMIETIKRGDRQYEARRCRECRTEQARERARRKRGSLPERFRV